MLPAACPARAQRGSSLIEVLVTVTVLSLGILAMANLQTTALKLGQSAYQRSQAVSLGYQIMDAMRANRSAALRGDYDRALDNPAPTATATDIAAAAADLQLWLRAVASAMQPFSAKAAISHHTNRFTVTIQWQNPIDRDRSDAQQADEAFVVMAVL